MRHRQFRKSYRAFFGGAIGLTLGLVLLLSGEGLFGQNDLTALPQFGSNPNKIVPYVPTPPEVVQKMLELAKVGQDDTVYDLGSGDGRIVIMAADKFGAHAVGVELDPDLYKQSEDRIKQMGLDKRAEILHEDFFNVNIRRATVVTLYLLTSVNERLKPMLEKQLRSGARVVSHDFQMPGWQPEKTEEVVDKNGLSHKVYLYVRP
ncbi:MAG: class I SAM-dependent methyltransferase [Acidobacteriia bacterium]|nr:class I SAM-dependent methyltransferase [Terriglobia bacterium]